MSWWYCLTHSTVEQGVGCRSGDRLGPYDSEADAASALQKARERTAEQDARDRADRGDA
ncbi:MAG: hypothetical protein JWN17_2895 [Frankiales bacterium]|nr:hypothetical protein [Frankiales bacterium]